jgi:hypothetical protein
LVSLDGDRYAGRASVELVGEDFVLLTGIGELHLVVAADAA